MRSQSTSTETTHTTAPANVDASKMSVHDVVAILDADVKRGLSSDRVAVLRGRYGRNELVEAPPPSVWQKLVRQFKDLVIWILIVAAVVSGALGEWVDTLAILAIVFLNGVIGFFQEERAEKALAALQKLSSPMAKVLRDGLLKPLPAAELVPGYALPPIATVAGSRRVFPKPTACCRYPLSRVRPRDSKLSVWVSTARRWKRPLRRK